MLYSIYFLFSNNLFYSKNFLSTFLQLFCIETTKNFFTIHILYSVCIWISFLHFVYYI